MGHYEIKPYVYKKSIEKNKCISTSGILENELMFLHLDFFFQSDKCLHRVHKI